MNTSRTLLISAALLVATPAVASAASIGGQNCDNPGAQRRANNSRFVCSPEGATSYWRRVEATPTIVGVVQALRGYSTFASVLKQSGLDVELATGGPYTIFAPRNAAFNKLSPDTLAALVRPDNAAALRRILRHHVVRGKLTARSLTTRTYETLDGTSISVRVGRNGISVDGAKVTMGDVVATDGILHGLGTVLIPSGIAIIP